MVRNYIRKSKRQSWLVNAMEKAVDAIINNTMNSKQTQIIFEVLKNNIFF
jgi:IS1 family transposase